MSSSATISVGIQGDGTNGKSAVLANGKEIRKRGPNCGVRHLQCVLLFFGLTVAYALRVNLSVAIVAMTDNSTNPDFETYNWDNKGVVLSSFFFGYVVTQVPSGQLAHRFGAKYLLFFGLLLCSVLAIGTPWLASFGGQSAVIAVRVVQGLSQGVVFPSTHNILSRWSPLEERGRLTTYCYAGSQFGTVIMLAVSGEMASSNLGWPSIFYISGLVGVVWSAAWLLFGSSSPSENRFISAEERNLIEKSQRVVEDGEKKSLPTPWLKIFTSPAFLSLTLVHCTHNWGFWTLLTEIPTYMNSVLGMDIKSNALYSSLPYLAMWIMCYVFAILADIMNKWECISLNFSRKFFNSVGHWIPMMALIGLGYMTKETTGLAIALLTLAVGMNAAVYLGFQVNHIDLAPNHAGTLMGITNCAANIMSLIAPLTVDAIVKDEKDPVEWRTVFFVSSGFYLVGNLLFIIFGKTQVRKWNDYGIESSTEMEGKPEGKNAAEP